MIDRRTLLGAMLGVLAGPRAARGQPAGKVPRLGILAPGSLSVAPHLFEAFRLGLRQHGWVEGQNILFEYRSSEGRDDRFPALAAELVVAKVNVIVAITVPAILAAQRATATIPIVMLLSSDPVRLGLVASLARPGGNTTGLASLIQDLAPKRLELLKETIPKLSRAAVLWNPENPAIQRDWELTATAAHALGVRLRSVELKGSGDLETAFAAILAERPEALVVVGDVLTYRLRTQIVEFAARHRLPAVYGDREFVEAGGLMSYGTNIADLFQRTGTYVHKILRGARPADLPVEQPTKLDLVVNLKTARALGLGIPQSVLVRADEIIK